MELRKRQQQGMTITEEDNKNASIAIKSLSTVLAPALTRARTLLTKTEAEMKGTADETVVA